MSFITKRIKSLFSEVENKPSARFQDVLESTRDKKVKKIVIGRKPVLSFVERALDTLSFGGYSKKKKELGYDDVFHNYAIVHFEDGNKIKIERNHRIEASQVSDKDYKNDTHYEVPIPEDKNLNLETMIDNASKNEKDYWIYRASINNCQNFTKGLIEKNDLVPKDPKILVNQESEKLIDTLVGKETVPNYVTDLANKLDRTIYGGQLSGETILNRSLPLHQQLKRIGIDTEPR